MPISKDLYSPQEVLSILRSTDKNLRQVALQLGCRPDNFYNWVVQQSPAFKAEIKQYRYRNGNYSKGRWSPVPSEFLALVRKHKYTLAGIANHYKVSSCLVSRWIKLQSPDFKLALKKARAEQPPPPVIKEAPRALDTGVLPIGRQF